MCFRHSFILFSIWIASIHNCHISAILWVDLVSRVSSMKGGFSNSPPFLSGFILIKSTFVWGVCSTYPLARVTMSAAPQILIRRGSRGSTVLKSSITRATLLFFRTFLYFLEFRMCLNQNLQVRNLAVENLLMMVQL